MSSNFNLFIYTAGTKEYASKIVNDVIDPCGKYIRSIFSRDNCMQIGHKYLKKISFTGMSDLNTIIIDDSEDVVALNAMNAIQIQK